MALLFGTTDWDERAMAKINVSLPDELLEQVDAIAHELDRSRSGLVAEATERYVASIEAERAAREREARIRAAMASMREIAKKVPPGLPVEEIIRRDRDTDRGRLLRPEDFK
jgi:predicted transcriptional regulator